MFCLCVLPASAAVNHAFLHISADTLIGQQLLQASEELQDDFQSFLDSLQAAAAAAGAHSTSASSSKQQQVLQLVQAQPQEAFRMFCWAQQLVHRGAVAVQPAAASSNSSSRHEQQSKLLLVPGLEVLPKVWLVILFLTGQHGGWTTVVHEAMQLQASANISCLCTVQDRFLSFWKSAAPIGAICSDPLASHGVSGFYGVCFDCTAIPYLPFPAGVARPGADCQHNRQHTDTTAQCKQP